MSRPCSLERSWVRRLPDRQELDEKLRVSSNIRHAAGSLSLAALWRARNEAGKRQSGR